MVWKRCVCDVDDFLILHSGRPIPSDSERVQRNEGVAIVFDSILARVWKDIVVEYGFQLALV